MGKLREITVFCEQGDSRQLRTWSNVPYFLTKTLEDRGVKVNRVNLYAGTNRWHKMLYKLWNVFAKGVFRNKFYTYRRSGLYFFLLERRVKKALRLYPDSQANLFFCYNFTTKAWCGKPLILLNDWTIDYDARFFKGLNPDELPRTEKRFIERQRRCIEEADLVVSLFPGMAADMRRVYTNPNIHYLGNVVNTLTEPDKPVLLERKRQGHDILFVGKKHYMKGANELIEAFLRLKATLPDARLHIIGMKASRFGALPEGATCYGYLDKGDPDACRAYYDLLSKCRLFINTTPRWGAFSASVEAMYHYTPVIITPYSEFVNTFGDPIPFGAYHQEDAGAGELCRQMEEQLADEGFAERAAAAHEAVAEMTWGNFVERLTGHIEKSI